MENRPPPRRPAFDEISSGWGADTLDDLTARCELLAEWWVEHLPLSLAELKVARAMSARLHNLGGLPPPVLAS